MSFQTRIIADTSQVDAALAETSRQVGDLSLPLGEWGEYMMNEIDDQFKNERDPYGAEWAPLTEAYARRKAKEGGIPKILQFKGTMRSKVSYQAGATQIAIGFNDRKARWHHEGSGNLPVRTLLPDETRGLPDRQAAKLERILEAYFESCWRSNAQFRFRAILGRF